MKKDDMVKEIIMMAEELRPLLDQCSMKVSYLDLEPEFPKLLKPIIEQGYKWLKHLYDNEYQTLRRTNLLLTPEMWKRYETWGILEESQEVLKRKKDRISFRRTVISQKRPDFWKKGKRNALLKEQSKPTEK